MPSLRSTVLWTAGTALFLYAALTVCGVVFILGHENKLAESIVNDHMGSIVWLYARILVGYLAAALLVALVLHPVTPGRRAAPATLLLAVLGFVYTLTDETHLLYGPLQDLFCAVHDATPAFVRDLYRPWFIPLALGGVVLLSLFRWTRPWPRALKAAGLAVVGLGAVAFAMPKAHAAPAAAPGPPCFVLIATDSLRADHLSCNGYARKTSPHIDALAARGTNFANCLVPTASTHESWVSMLTSTEPRDNGLRHMFPSREQVERIESTQVFMPRVLKEKGYRTAAIGGWCGTTFNVFDAGFDHVDVSNSQNYVFLLAEAAFTNHLLAAAFLDNPLGRALLPELETVSFTRGATALTGKARRWLADAAGRNEPFFLVVVYHVTHLPYSASFPYYTLFTDPAYRGRNRYRIDFRVDEQIKRGFDDDLAPEERRHIKDLYDGTIREFDDQVGAIVAALDELGLGERTIVGVLGDHGDNLYEHGTTLGHGVTLFGGDGANHIPAVFAGPGVPQRKVEKLVRSFDLAPTWFGWLGFDRPQRWRGVDLGGEVPDLTALLETSYLLYRQPVPDLMPGEEMRPFPRVDDATFFDPDFGFNPVLKDGLDDLVVETKCFAVRQADWKLIYVPGMNGPIWRLFDLAQDPECERDVRADHADVFERLKKQMPEHVRNQ